MAKRNVPGDEYPDDVVARGGMLPLNVGFCEDDMRAVTCTACGQIPSMEARAPSEQRWAAAKRAIDNIDDVGPAAAEAAVEAAVAGMGNPASVYAFSLWKMLADVTMFADPDKRVEWCSCSVRARRQYLHAVETAWNDPAGRGGRAVVVFERLTLMRAARLLFLAMMNRYGSDAFYRKEVLDTARIVADLHEQGILRDVGEVYGRGSDVWEIAAQMCNWTSHFRLKAKLDAARQLQAGLRG